VPVDVPTISDRETLFRSFVKQVDADGSFASVNYSVEDVRYPVEKGRVRATALTALLVREAPGTDGEMSEVFRVSRMDPKFAKGLGFINSTASKKASELIAAPLIELKRKVEDLLDGYTPPLVDHVVEELDLTWRDHLWRMSLEAALGVQYLHHHRYWSDGGTRIDGNTNMEVEEAAGWKVRRKERERTGMPSAAS
jgi:hypothetical protein